MTSSPALSPSVFDGIRDDLHDISTQDPDEWCVLHGDFIRLCAHRHLDPSVTPTRESERRVLNSPPPKRVRRTLDFGPSNYFLPARVTLVPASPQPEPAPPAAALESATETATETVPETPADYKTITVNGVTYASNDGDAGLVRLLAGKLETTLQRNRDLST